MYSERTGSPPRAQQRQRAEPQRFRMLQFLMVALLAYMFLPALFRTQPYYSLEANQEYTIRRHTVKLRVLFFARNGYLEYIRKGQSYREEIDRQVDQ